MPIEKRDNRTIDYREHVHLEPRHHPNADGMPGRIVATGSALAPLRLDDEFQCAPVRRVAAAHQPPAQAVVAPGVGEADGDLRRRREPAAEGRETISEPGLQPPFPKSVAGLVRG